MMAWHKVQALEISPGKASFPPNEAKGLASAESSSSLIAYTWGATKAIYCGAANRERLLFRRLGKAVHLESSSKTPAYSSMKSTATATISGSVIPAAGEIVTHGRLLRSTVTGLPVRLTSAVTRPPSQRSERDDTEET